MNAEAVAKMRDTDDDFRVPVDVKRVIERLEESDCIPEIYQKLLDFVKNL